MEEVGGGWERSAKSERWKRKVVEEEDEGSNRKVLDGTGEWRVEEEGVG